MDDARLVVLNACDTGSDLGQSDNIIKAFNEAGADAVIGFYHRVGGWQSDEWGKAFWTLMATGLDAYDASRQAARWVADAWYAPIVQGGNLLLGPIHTSINEDSVVYLGDPHITLVDPNSTR